MFCLFRSELAEQREQGHKRCLGGSWARPSTPCPLPRLCVAQVRKLGSTEAVEQLLELPPVPGIKMFRKVEEVAAEADDVYCLPQVGLGWHHLSFRRMIRWMAQAGQASRTW